MLSELWALLTPTTWLAIGAQVFAFGFGFACGAWRGEVRRARKSRGAR